MKGINEICSEADKNKGDWYKLQELLDCVKKERLSYPVEDYEFMIEHIDGYVKILQDRAKVKSFLERTSN